jgi:hypothetical protein
VLPSLSVEKEFAQAAGRIEATGLTDRQVFHKVLSEKEYSYLIPQVCFVMTIQGLQTYILTARYSAVFDLLVEAVRPEPNPMDLDVVIGVLGPIAGPDVCNRLMLPIVGVDQTYSFDRNSLIQSIPRPDKITAKEFGPAAEEVFDRIIQMTANNGLSEAHRALNYLAVRSPDIYAKAVDAFGRNASLSAIETRPSPLSGARKIMEVIFSYTNRNTDVTEKSMVQVDVTSQFPFLVKRLSPYYDR